MAKGKRVKSKRVLIPIPDWDHADDILHRMAGLQLQIENAEADAKRRMDAIVEETALSVDSMREKITLYTESLEAYAASHAGEFAPLRSRKLNFGEIGWRASTAIKINAKNTLKMIKSVFTPSLRKLCILTKETVSKDGLAKLTDEQLHQVNARRERKDAFFAEPFDYSSAEHGEAK